MSNELPAVDMDVVQSIYTEAAAIALASGRQGTQFDMLLHGAFEAAAVLAQAKRERQSQGQDN